MNPCLPDWNFEYDLPLTNQKKNTGSDQELVELLWQNGQVILHSQNHRKPTPNQHESCQSQKHDQRTMRGGGSYGNSSNFIQDDETVSWIQYPVEDSFEKEFCSNFFNELPVPHPMEVDKAVRQVEAEKIVKSGSLDDALNTSNQQFTSKRALVPEFSGNHMLPPRVQFAKSAQHNVSGNLGKVVNFSQFASPVKGDLRSSSLPFGGDARECSVMTVGSSHCGSNQIVNDPDFSRASSNVAGTAGFSAGTLKEDVHKNTVSQSEGRKTETLEPTVTSSSGGSDSSFGGSLKESAGASSHKRKGRDNEESECQSEAAEPEAASGKKPATRSGSIRRSRAAEVHNLSERRRRDRINKKMKALQELIPHCNKTDKASMLDEAIEYLKSLQLQLQVMWMGGGMAPMMFPGVQHYMSSMGMTMCPPPPMPTVANNMHLPQVPVVDQSIPMAPNPNQSVICHTPVLTPMNFQNHMQSPSFPEQFARYMGIHHMQAASQPMNMFKFGPQTAQQIQTGSLPGSISGQYSGGAANDASSGKMG